MNKVLIFILMSFILNACSLFEEDVSSIKIETKDKKKKKKRSEKSYGHWDH